MSLYIIARFHAKPGKIDALRSAIAGVMERTRPEPGCLYARFFQSTSDAALFFIHSGWRHEADFDEHAKLPHVIDFINSWEQLLDQQADVVRTTECLIETAGKHFGRDERFV
jgi:quinol monooxygenase YgiN